MKLNILIIILLIVLRNCSRCTYLCCNSKWSDINATLKLIMFIVIPLFFQKYKPTENQPTSSTLGKVTAQALVFYFTSSSRLLTAKSATRSLREDTWSASGSSGFVRLSHINLSLITHPSFYNDINIRRKKKRKFLCNYELCNICML